MYYTLTTQKKTETTKRNAETRQDKTDDERDRRNGETDDERDRSTGWVMPPSTAAYGHEMPLHSTCQFASRFRRYIMQTSQVSNVQLEDFRRYMAACVNAACMDIADCLRSKLCLIWPQIFWH
eukprot:gnl/TRDRNA2_/TRDRNA2_145749_c0_seq1.p1 gnl/TRDRNA2_/TRDRNA2_145749_c0~~gnl/TRDRNA2_/TRDRNA2_145749_c0_seq1.p1  ORF type:complete len:123 (-),score=9.13 gnl/TRDRNA2_/TRDRNA2_145749_c0_seq1:234-602(-)